MVESTTQNEYPFLAGGGEMGELTRQYDWSKTALGTPDQWPQSLRATLSIILNARFPMFLWWGDDLIQFYNDAYRPSLGNSGKHPLALGQKGVDCWPEIWPVIKPLIDEVLAGGEATWSEDQLIPIYRNNTLEDVYWTFSYSPVKDESGRTAGVLVICTETTSIITRRNELEEAQRQLLTLFEESPVAIAIISADKLTFQMANPFYAQLAGRKPDELIGKPMMEALPELWGQGFDQMLEQVIATGIPYIASEVAVNVVRQGRLETLYLDVTCQPRREKIATERITGLLIVCTDVTQQVLTRRKVEASEAKLRSIIATAPAGMGLFVGRDLIIGMSNQTFIDMVGKGPDIEGKPLRQVMPELVIDNQPFLQILDDVYTSGQMYQSFGDQVNILQQGVMTHNFYNISFTPLRDETGQVYAILDISIDVTQEIKVRQELQQELQQAEMRLQGAIELAELSTWSLDIPRNIFTYSERFMNWLGFSEDTKEADDVYNSVPEEYRQATTSVLAAAIQPGSSGIYRNEHPIINRLTGQVRIISVQGQLFYDADGKPAVISGTAQDITQQRQLQLALEQQVQQRTEELERVNEALAANIDQYATINEALEEANSLLLRSNDNLERFAYVASHDLQEPLRKVQQFGDLLKSRFTDASGEELVYIERMQSAASRMSTLIRDLLGFARISTQRETSEPVSLNDVINTVMTDFEMVIAETGAIVDVESLPTVSGDAVQLTQLVQNLVSNALKFSRVDGLGKSVTPQIQIKSQLIDTGNLPVSVKPARVANTYYRIDVIDNGIGFEEKYVDRIFQVFQRLHGKNQFAGTGIGLAICEKVAVNHGGAITARSQPGQGTTFSVYLPR